MRPLLLLFALNACTSNVTHIKTLHVPEGSTDTSDHPITLRKHETITLGDLTVDNDFPGGAFASAQRAPDGSVEITIAPENSPINDSAWFAFRLTSLSRGSRDVKVTLRYDGGTHRYDPKLSTDGVQWRSVGKDALSVAADKTHASIVLSLSDAPLYVAAQEVITQDAMEPWLSALAQRSFVKRAPVGTSVAGRNIDALRVTQGDGPKDYLIVLGRQHPPEVTGTLALMAFVDAICSESERARAFRERYETIVIPMINPDGVADGHWRHNLHGVDLNRDWEFFRQAETRAVRDALVSLPKNRVAFAIDFHSTFKDVFYVLPETATSTPLAATWIAALAARLPNYQYRVQAVTMDVPAASIWLNRTFGAPTVTYEVGDATERTGLREIAMVAADEIMRLLLARR
jgi:hypothetical protein